MHRRDVAGRGVGVRGVAVRGAVAGVTLLVVGWFGAGDLAVASSCWYPPVDAAIIDPFREPPCAWCAGNRGLEFGTAPGAPIRAVATGVVTFSGDVAGVTYLVVGHADGRRVTYGGIADRSGPGLRLAAGDVVLARQPVGVTTGTFHLGLRDGERYLDPAPYLGRVVTRARLVPADGTPARSAPATRLRCAG